MKKTLFFLALVSSFLYSKDALAHEEVSDSNLIINSEKLESTPSIVEEGHFNYNESIKTIDSTFGNLQKKNKKLNNEEPLEEHSTIPDSEDIDNIPNKSEEQGFEKIQNENTNFQANDFQNNDLISKLPPDLQKINSQNNKLDLVPEKTMITSVKKNSSAERDDTSYERDQNYLSKDIKKTWNTRDIGAYVTQDGYSIASRKVFRSDNLSKLSEEDILYLENFNVRTVIDFRTPGQVKKAPDVQLNNATIHHYSVLGKKALAYGQGDSYFYTSGQLQFGEAAIESYKRFFSDLLSLKTNESLLYHCTAGKDRTGIATVLLLTALGVDKQTIYSDYLLTNFYYQNTYRSNKELVKKAWLDKYYDDIENAYGSLENYIRVALEIDDYTVNELKKLLLTDYRTTSNEVLILEDKIQLEVRPLIFLQDQLSTTELQTQTIPYENQNLMIDFVKDSCSVKENKLVPDRYVGLGNLQNINTINKKEIGTPHHLPKTAVVENRGLAFLGSILLILTGIFFISLKKSSQ
ncbi:hypothetical protein BCR24_15125 [Enterococcus ureilyticus]|uniref:Tyrosine specific protein phosphatases domain-containing protein n=1 Tax=Enterococcus ureilyticus TaxID=1131292 RepID=A0A1E5HC64_9ENTE|nr:tyrosine-protein phosphatase [Enterococcus ureilyticus]MBM7690559.1 protein-tyrosine phosphatase [Enterococcus ureilyticus]OEG22537.1 hypothetical protein BCR24_15125 [Enterococcus ureilyticus]